MKKINLLPEHIIDQIKAGEVIERPSTLIKEIVENSVDAGSKNIDLSLVNNGMDLISLIDDGHGISKNDLPLAFCRHATSKIEKFEDLYSLYSYGFRGEALASIASISRISCESTTREGESSLIKIEGGEIITHTSLGQQQENHGTKLYIKDLFYNTPVRMKFLQSKASEKNQLRKIINSFLLVQPEVRFSLKWDDQEKETYPAVQKDELEKRVQKVIFKRNQNQKLISFEQDYDGVFVKGFLSEDSSRGNNNKAHYIFVNNRFVQDIALHKIILNNAANLWPFGEVGQYVLYIELPPEQVDVNVHPNKTVVKIYESSKVQSIVSGALKKAISATSRPEQDEKEYSFEQSPTNFFRELADSDHSIDFKPIQYKTVDESVAENNFYRSHGLDNDIENIFLSSHFYLYKTEDNKFFIIDIESLLRKLFLKRLKKGQQSSTLLISIPYQDKAKTADPIFNDLADFGYELDRLDPNTVAIRSIPLNSHFFNHADIFEKLANTNKKLTSIDQFLSLIDNISFDLKFINQKQLELILKEISLSELVQNSIAKELNEKNLRKFFS